jgi:hypothetical protein
LRPPVRLSRDSPVEDLDGVLGAVEHLLGAHFGQEVSELLGPGSVRNVYDVPLRVMTAAVEDKVIASSPCRRITLPPTSDEEVTLPTVAQVEATARVMPPYIRAAIVTLADQACA